MTTFSAYASRKPKGKLEQFPYDPARWLLMRSRYAFWLEAYVALTYP